MKKNLLLLLVFAAVAVCGNARERTLAEKQALARQFTHAPERMKKAQAKNHAEWSVLFDNGVLTVMGCDNTGFAIVVNDDQLGTVAGYSDAAYDETNEGLKWFLNNVSSSLSDNRLSTINRKAAVPPSEKYKPSVDHLLTSTWNQNSPYNDLCPKDTKGAGYPSGCVATALSQIMYFHKYPETGQGSKQYSFKPAEGVGELLSANFGETTYDWAHMLDNYVSGSYTEEQGNAVATIMLHCGVAVEMNYTPTGSGAYSSEARNGLVSFFKYHQNAGLLYRTYYSLEEWMDIIYNELNCNRPIYYAGADANRGGHAFVLDGYDSNGFVHINWGWGANGGNGYFDITLLNPSGYEFSQGQDMIIGIDKPDADIVYESHVVSEYPLTVSKFGTMLNVSPGTRLWNLCGYKWSGQVGIILKDATQTYVLKSVTAKDVANRYDVLSSLTDKDATLDGMCKLPSGIADGEYRLFIGSKDDRDTDWCLVRRSNNVVNNYKVTVADCKLAGLVADTDDTWPREMATAIQTVTLNKDMDHTKVYNLRGQFVGNDINALPSGVYIVGGKKVVK